MDQELLDRIFPDLPGAGCRDADPDLFFPPPGRGASRQIATAKGICRACPVRRACLNWALGNNEDAGVWGGLTREERRGLRRQN
jgi:WhiB family redox-sensing transcriptional regulator